MNVVYIPKGKAREYSPLALNIYNGCDFDCRYCYVTSIKSRFNNNYIHKDVYERKGLLSSLEKQLRKGNINDQVLLCFTGDPYCKFNDKARVTRKVLKVLTQYNVPTAILSKGGSRILTDLDIIKEFKTIKVGATLTFVNEEDSIRYEPRAAIPEERFNTLKILKENGVMTWVSLEPVIDVMQTLKIISMTHEYVDQYKIGKLNHNKAKENEIDWNNFLRNAVVLMRKYNKDFYIKKDLLEYQTDDIEVSENETDMNYLALNKEIGKQAELF